MSLTKENLVVLKGSTRLIIRESHTVIEPNVHYRCIKDGDTYIIFGEPIDKQTFDDMFEFLHDRMMREFKVLGLLKDGKPISKSAFKDAMNIHQYGKGKQKNFKGFFGDKLKGLFAFDNEFQGDTKAKFIDYAYHNYVCIVGGNMTSVDNTTVQRGNNGIPILYGSLYFRKLVDYVNPKESEIYY